MLRRRVVLRSRLAVLPLVLALLGLACGCTKAAVTAPPPKADASVTARSGTPVLSLHVHPVEASVGETITATVSYHNPSAKRCRFVVGASEVYNVRVTDASGDVVFDSAPSDRPFKMAPVLIDLAPGATSSGEVEFRLKAPGDYDVVAFTNSGPQLETPPVRVVVPTQ